MIIVVSGTPGTGKSLLAKDLAKKLKFEYLDVNKLIKEQKLYDSYDKKRACFIVDLNKLNRFLIKVIKNKNMIVDGHLSHFLPKKYVDWCIITKCDLKILKKRLEKRRYNKEKIRENLDSEIFDVCLNEARDLQHKIIVVDTTKGIKKILKNLSF